MESEIPKAPVSQRVAEDVSYSVSGLSSRSTNFVSSADSVLFLMLIAGLAWAPFWLGSNRPLAWGVNGVLFPGLALCYESVRIFEGVPHPIAIKNIFLPVALFAVAVLFIVVQTSTAVPFGWIYPIWNMASDVLSPQSAVSGSISVNRDLTWLALLRLITAASVFWLSLQLCRKTARSHLLLLAIATIVAAYAAYGIIAFAITPGYVLWMQKVDHSVSSTFVGRNNFATYAGIGLVTQIGVLFRLYRHEVGQIKSLSGFRIALLIETTGRKGIWLLCAIFVTLSALMLTASRGGIIATGLGCFILVLLTFNSSRNRPTDQLDAIVFVTAVIAAVFMVFGDAFLGRIASQDGIYDANRAAVYSITLSSILDAPFLGFGYGTFIDVFPIYRDQSVPLDGNWDKAHNTYLEIFQGLGLLFGSALIAAVALLVYQSFIGIRKRKQSATIAAVATAVSILVGVHALVDFSLQIQAVTLTFMAILGAGVAQSESSRKPMED